MTDTGIGASVRRKEDYRFLTGNGRYLDDMNRPGQAYAYLGEAHYLEDPKNNSNLEKAIYNSNKAIYEIR